MHSIVEKILARDQRMIARAISIIENDMPDRQEILQQLYKDRQQAHLLGITGSPGTGKSTITNGLIHVLRENGFKVGVIAVDPTSPFTGGALLGDRVRMQNHFLDTNVFIRSMGTRGSNGGLSRATQEAAIVLEAAGFDMIIVETVGVGQSELEIMNIADSVVVVLAPESGDFVQACKAGIMEIAHLFVINKADLPGADKTARGIRAMLEVACRGKTWRPPILKTVGTENKGIDDLWSKIEYHFNYLQEIGLLEMKRKNRIQNIMENIVFKSLTERISTKISENRLFDHLIQQAYEGKVDPYTAAESFLSKYNDRIDD